MVHKISVPSLDKIDDAAHEFLALMGDSTIYAFYGSMGAGKTTFINALSKALGVEEESLEEAFDIGVEDYFDSGALCLIEWPERVEDILPDDTVRVDINVLPDDSREIVVDIPE